MRGQLGPVSPHSGIGLITSKFGWHFRHTDERGYKSNQNQDVLSKSMYYFGIITKFFFHINEKNKKTF